MWSIKFSKSAKPRNVNLFYTFKKVLRSALTTDTAIYQSLNYGARIGLFSFGLNIEAHAFYSSFPGIYREKTCVWIDRLHNFVGGQSYAPFNNLIFFSTCLIIDTNEGYFQYLILPCHIKTLPQWFMGELVDLARFTTGNLHTKITHLIFTKIEILLKIDFRNNPIFWALLEFNELKETYIFSFLLNFILRA